MTQTANVGRAFFASIPKCGKNVLYSFFSGLGLQRLPQLETGRDLAVQYTYAHYFADLDMRSTFAFHALTAPEMSQLTSGMEQFLANLSSMPQGTVLNHHFAFYKPLYETLQKEKIPTVFLYRDPRDCLLSMANYITVKAMPSHLGLKLKHLHLDEVLTLLLTGDKSLVAFAPYFDCFRGWLEAEGVFKLRFEDIIGMQGGGRQEIQVGCLTALAEHIGWEGNIEQLTKAILSSFNPQAGTFFKGRVGAWKEGFSRAVNDTFAKHAGTLIPAWGYDEAKAATHVNGISSKKTGVQGGIFLSNEEKQIVTKSALQKTEPAETRVRILHDLLREAQDFPDVVGPYVRFLRSLRERLHPLGVRDIRTVELETGLKFCVDVGDRLGCDFYYGHYQELYESQIFLEMLDPGAIVLDVGANFGYYTVTVAAQVGVSGVVHAFEPHPDAYALLCDNVKGNGLPQVRCHNFCIGAEDGTTKFYVTHESSFSGMALTGRAVLREHIVAPIRKVDSFVTELGIECVDALKIDVEGFEFAVLQGVRATLLRSPQLFIMLEVSQKNLDVARHRELVAALGEVYASGFRGWVVDTQLDGIRQLSDAQQAADLGGANIFLVRTNSERERRLLEASKNLRLRAYEGFASALSFNPTQLLQRNEQDPHHGLRLHAALLVSVLRDRDEKTQRQELQIRTLERENQTRLEHIQSLASCLQDTENDSQARLKEIRKRDGMLADVQVSIRELEAKVAHLQEARDRVAAEREQLAAAFQEQVGVLEAQVQQLVADKKAVESETVRLGQESARWRREAERTTWARVRRSFRLDERE